MPPKRTKNQILEDKSRRVFEEVLPEEWVVRTIPKDYGIDTEVEIFEANQASGLTFKVQLKSTATIKTQLPSQSVSISHLQYWLSLDVPVMIALYVEADNAFYYRWASSHDPGIDGWSKKSTTIRYDGRKDELQGRGLEVRSEVALLRQLRLHKMPTVIPLRLTSKIATISNARFVQKLRGRLRQSGLSQHFEVVVDAQSPALHIEATKHHLKVSFPLNTGSMTAHSRGNFQVAKTEDLLTGNSLDVLAALLSSHDNPDQAVAIMEGDKFGGTVWHLEDVAEALAMAMFQAKRPDLAIDYARACFEIHGVECFELTETYLIPAITKADEIDLQYRPDLLALLQAIVDAALEAEKRELAGRLYFNMGRISRMFEEPVAAMAHYALALKHRPAYASSRDYWGIYAGAQFRARNYRGAAESYEKAWQLRDSENDQTLLPEFADALLYAGELQKCDDLLQVGYSGKLSRLANVDRAAVRQIRSITGLEAQDRVPEMDDAEAPTSEHEIIDRLRNSDALDPRLWQALLEMTAEPSVDLAVTVARLNTKSAAAWAFAAVLAFRENRESELMRSVLEMALADAPDDFEDAIPDAAGQRLAQSEQGELAAMFEDIAGTTTEDRPAPLRQLLGVPPA